MLNNLRNFSKSKPAMVLIAIIIVPFVFWGMGSVFSGGNTNTVAKINNNHISTQDFFNFIKESRIDEKSLKDNLDKNIMQEIVSQLISINLLEMEISDLGVSLSDESLYKKITKDKKFLDKDNKFSRIEYEKFLLENNISAVDYETRIKDSELQKDLFQYISGGVKTPSFLVENYYLEDTKEINIEYINLEKNYKNKFSIYEIKTYINENIDEVSRDYIDISYSKIVPKNLINSDDYTSEFFSAIDNLENDILNGYNVNDISKKYNIVLEKKYKYLPNELDDKFLKEIYKKREINKIELIDKDDYYLLYEINKIYKLAPDVNSDETISFISNKLRNINKFKFNKEILKKIETNDFSYEEFKKIAEDNNKIKKTIIKSKSDNSIFNIDSLNLIYNIPKNNYLLIVDNDEKVYLTKIIDFKYKKISKNSEDYNKYILRSNFRLKNNISSSYDDFLNTKYEVEINQKTIERIKNYFK